jgi:cytochrome bd-type quinol oxidase subunit 2
MPQPEPTPLPLRVLVFAVIGCALVTGWLQPLYEMFVVDGGVYVPRWWSLLQFTSLLVLLVLCFALMRRHRRLCIISWGAFWMSLLANVMPGYL